MEISQEEVFNDAYGYNMSSAAYALFYKKKENYIGNNMY